MKPRTRARSIALQVLYEVDQSDHPPHEVLENRLQEITEDPEEIATFSRRILEGVHPLQTELDAQLAKFAPEWPVEQVAIIDRNILRIALWELLYNTDAPIKVVINEAIELGKLFGSDSTPRFVNGVLGSLVDNLNTIKQQFKIT